MAERGKEPTDSRIMGDSKCFHFNYGVEFINNL